MKRIFLVFAFCAASSILTATSTFGADEVKAWKPLWIKVDGNKFVTQRGESMIFRGLALSDPDKLEKNRHWNPEYFQKAREWGATLVRFPVHPAAWRARGPQAYLKMLDQGVRWARENQLYVIIDWHSIGNLKAAKFQDPMYDTTQKETLEFWRTIAARYREEPTVAFFEIFNEPTTYQGKLGDMTWSEWRVIAESIIAAIREKNKRAVPLVGGLDWAYDLTPVGTEPLRAAGIGYTVHPYPQKRAQPEWDTKWQQDFGFVAEKYPVFATEFGFERQGHVPCVGTPEYGRRVIDFLESKGISWTPWCFDPNWFPTLISDWNFTPTEQGEFFRAELLKRGEK